MHYAMQDDKRVRERGNQHSRASVWLCAASVGMGNISDALQKRTLFHMTQHKTVGTTRHIFLQNPC